MRWRGKAKMRQMAATLSGARASLAPPSDAALRRCGAIALCDNAHFPFSAPRPP